ncbi:Probable receptor-like protein kinase At4g10390 [Linum perenne]
MCVYIINSFIIINKLVSRILGSVSERLAHLYLFSFLFVQSLYVKVFSGSKQQLSNSSSLPFLLQNSPYQPICPLLLPPTAPSSPLKNPLSTSLFPLLCLLLTLLLSFSLPQFFCFPSPMAFACIPNFLITRRRRRNPNGDQVAAVSDDDTSADFVTVKKPDGDSPIMYNWGEIEKLTQNFSCLIGSGGFSNVYLANFAGGTAAAVKVSCSGDYLSPLFNQELDIMLRLRHRNIVKLLGYSFDQAGGALVMEYVPKGTLQDNLHGSQLPLLSWGERMAIAYQLAEAIDYLHEKCDLPIVHGDIKSSNLVLDANLNCKLCDFGSAKMGFSSAVVMQGQGRRRLVMTGSPGYTDPHYLRTGLASKKNDIYSYGVIVLELLTGREAFSEVKGEMLASIMGPMMMMSRDGEARGDVGVVASMVDQRLGGEFDIEEAKAMFCLAGKCIDMSPAVRPNATQIVEMMKEYVESAVALSMCSSTSSKDWSTSYERE